MGTIREMSPKAREGHESRELIRSGNVPFAAGDIVELPKRGREKVVRFTLTNAVIQFPDGNQDLRHVQKLKPVTAKDR